MFKPKTKRSVCVAQQGIVRAECSKSLSSKAAGESKPEAYPLGYVEDFDEPRTKLEDFFSILPEVQDILACRCMPLKATEGQTLLEGCEAVCYTDSHKARARSSFRFHFSPFGETMATGREKDRKTRKKHRKNVARVKTLATVRRSKAKKSKKG